MSQRINTTTIGLFIVTGVALGLIGLLLFSSSKMFSQSRDLIVYFNESLNGLNEGAPVKFRGVTIGSVKRVMVRFNQATNDFAMPVILEIEDRLVPAVGGCGRRVSLRGHDRGPDPSRPARLASDRESRHRRALRGYSDQSQSAAGLPPA
jgi:paraquat-inducible protein B